MKECNSVQVDIACATSMRDSACCDGPLESSTIRTNKTNTKLKLASPKRTPVDKRKIDSLIVAVARALQPMP